MHRSNKDRRRLQVDPTGSAAPFQLQLLNGLSSMYAYIFKIEIHTTSTPQQKPHSEGVKLVMEFH